MLHLYKSYWLHILEVDLVKLVDQDYQKMEKYVIANTGKDC